MPFFLVGCISAPRRALPPIALHIAIANVRISARDGQLLRELTSERCRLISAGYPPRWEGAAGTLFTASLGLGCCRCADRFGRPGQESAHESSAALLACAGLARFLTGPDANAAALGPLADLVLTAVGVRHTASTCDTWRRFAPTCLRVEDLVTRASGDARPGRGTYV